MRNSAILILLCAAAVPVATIAETTDTTIVKTKWRLKPPPRKPAPKILPKATPVQPRLASNEQGPAVPAAQRPPKVKAPRKKAPPKARRERVNPAPIVAVIKHGERKN